MNVLLLSMPDAFEHTPALTIRMPNGALASLAGNVDGHHRVAAADLVLARHDVGGTVRHLLQTHRPDVVGLSVMTFQRHTALRIVELVRRLRPEARIVVGGYDPSLAPAVYEADESGVDAIVHGEGDVTFRELLRAYESGRTPDGIPGVTCRIEGRILRQPRRLVSRDLDREIRPPNRASRVLSGYTFLGRPIDVVETSRGCTFDCTFCSIVEMRGRQVATWSVERVIADIADAARRGARAIFIVDDNITLNVDRFRDICDAIVRAGLHRLDYLVQGMTSAIAAGGHGLAAAMRRAGFRYVFLGIENVLDKDLAFLGARAKNAVRGGGRTAGSATLRAVELVHQHGMFVVGGLIVGNPDDSRESIEANLAFAASHVDWPYIQHPTPYPGTPMTRDFIARNLVLNEAVDQYDGTTAVVRTQTLEAEDVEFLRWRAERWMKLRHLPPVFWHDPGFVSRHALAMLRHTFRGMTWRTWLGLEPEREAFRRYARLRAAEREFLPRSEAAGPPGRIGYDSQPGSGAEATS